jgi:glycosyltransferase involved in cell wall biosynthesis
MAPRPGQRALDRAPQRDRLRHQRDAWRSFHHADLINVSNSDDLTALQSRYGTKVVYFPLGISSMRLAALREARASIADRLAARTVAFVGTWNTGKGSRDWPEIHDRLRRLVPDVRVLLLGTGIPREHVRAWTHETYADRLDRQRPT